MNFPFSFPSLNLSDIRCEQSLIDLSSNDIDTIKNSTMATHQTTEQPQEVTATYYLNSMKTVIPWHFPLYE